MKQKAQNMGIFSGLKEQGVFGGRRPMHFHRLCTFPEQQKFSYLRLVQSYQFIFIFMELVHHEYDSGFARVASPTGRYGNDVIKRGGKVENLVIKTDFTPHFVCR